MTISGTKLYRYKGKRNPKSLRRLNTSNIDDLDFESTMACAKRTAASLISRRDGPDPFTMLEYTLTEDIKLDALAKFAQCNIKHFSDKRASNVIKHFLIGDLNSAPLCKSQALKDKLVFRLKDGQEYEATEEDKQVVFAFLDKYKHLLVATNANYLAALRHYVQNGKTLPDVKRAQPEHTMD